MEELVYVKTKLMNSTNEATSLVISVTEKTGNFARLSSWAATKIALSLIGDFNENGQEMAHV